MTGLTYSIGEVLGDVVLSRLNCDECGSDYIDLEPNDPGEEPHRLAITLCHDCCGHPAFRLSAR